MFLQFFSQQSSMLKRFQIENFYNSMANLKYRLIESKPYAVIIIDGPGDGFQNRHGKIHHVHGKVTREIQLTKK